MTQDERTSKTQAALLTPRTAGAIAVIAVVGRGARSILSSIAGPKVRMLQAGTTALVKVKEESGEILDEALLVCLNEESWELHVHGGTAVVEAALELLQRHGVEIAEAAAKEPELILGGGEGGIWKRGIGAEILAALPRALTSTAVHLLAGQAQAGLTAWARQWRAALQKGGALWHFQSSAQWVLDRSRALEQFVEPPRVAIAGPPNAGKSTLANALLGRPASITSDVAGTTRDWVDAAGILAAHGSGGVQLAVTLVDTAGIRGTQDIIEQEAIARTHVQVAAADAVIAVIDGAVPLDLPTKQWVEDLTAQLPVVLAINKCDRGALVPARELGLSAANVEISALEHRGLALLAEHVLALLGVAEVRGTEPWAFTQRQKEALQNAGQASSSAEAQAYLMELADG